MALSCQDEFCIYQWLVTPHEEPYSFEAVFLKHRGRILYVAAALFWKTISLKEKYFIYSQRSINACSRLLMIPLAVVKGPEMVFDSLLLFEHRTSEPWKKNKCHIIKCFYNRCRRDRKQARGNLDFHIEIIWLWGSNPHFEGALLVDTDRLSALLISSHWNVPAALGAVHLIPFHVSKENIYMQLLLNFSMMSIWEIKLKHQSNDFSTDTTSNDTRDRQLIPLFDSAGRRQWRRLRTDAGRETPASLPGQQLWGQSASLAWRPRGHAQFHSEPSHHSSYYWCAGNCFN